MVASLSFTFRNDLSSRIFCFSRELQRVLPPGHPVPAHGQEHEVQPGPEHVPVPAEVQAAAVGQGEVVHG